MQENRRTIFGIVVYVALTFASSSFFYRAIIRQGNLSPWLVTGLMWCPGVSGLITRLVFQQTLRGVGWRWGKWKYQLWSYGVPIMYSAAAYLPLWAAGYADFHAQVLNRFASTVHIANISRPLIVAAFVVIGGTVGMISSCLSAAGEELGWRGFLVPELAKVTSFGWVALISGAVWAIWHVPLIIGGNYHGAGPVWYSILCFVVLVVGASFVFAWMRLKSGSVWTGMFLHASHNLFIQGIFDPLTRHARMTDYMTGEFGAGLAITAGGVAYILWRRKDQLPPLALSASPQAAVSSS